MYDAHCHLSFFSSEQLDSVLAEYQKASWLGILMAGFEPKDWQRQIEIANEHKTLQLATCFGLHPWYCDEAASETIDHALKELERYFSTCPPVACGEIGLDFFRVKSEQKRKLQIDYFENQLNLAAKYELPLVIHSVRAHHEIIRILKKQHFPYGGIIHDFNASLEVHKSYLDLGFYPSIARSSSLSKLDLSLDFLLESDAPQADAQAYQRISQLFELLAQRKQVSLDELLSRQANLMRSIFPKLLKI